jgi:hypothetical protein
MGVQRASGALDVSAFITPVGDSLCWRPVGQLLAKMAIIIMRMIATKVRSMLLRWFSRMRVSNC